MRRSLQALFVPDFNLAVDSNDKNSGLVIRTRGNFLPVDMFSPQGPISNPVANPFSNGAIPQNGSPSGLDSSLSVYICSTEQDVENSLAVEASISGSYLGASASLSASASKYSKVDATSVNTILVANQWVSQYSFSDTPILVDDALKLAASDPETFMSTYGTHFVDTIYTGCQLSIEMITTVSSSDMKQSLSATLKGAYNGGAFSIDAAASIKAQAEQIDKKSTFKINALSNIPLSSFPRTTDELKAVYEQWSASCQQPGHAPVQMVKLNTWMNIPAFASACRGSDKCVQAFKEMNSMINPVSVNQLSQTRLGLQLARMNLNTMQTNGYFTPVTTVNHDGVPEKVISSNDGFHFVSDLNVCGADPQDVTNVILDLDNVMNQLGSLIDTFPDYLSGADGKSVASYVSSAKTWMDKANSVINCVANPTRNVPAFKQFDCAATCSTNAGRTLPIEWKGAKCSSDQSGLGSNTVYRCERTGSGWASVQDTTGDNGTSSCSNYCAGTGGGPWNNELPSSWNGAACAAAYYLEGNGSLDCNAVPNTNIRCTCYQTGQGWAA
jgi:hypothetical protein